MGGGGGGPAPQAQTQTVTNTNIPDYARPYVESMLGATQQQLFNTAPNESGGVDITGVKPYVPYSKNPQDYVAGFSPLQQSSFDATKGLQTPAQYGQAIGVTGAGIQNAADIGASATPQNFQQQVGGYMNPYMKQVLDPQMAELRRQYGISGNQQAAQATQAGAFGGSRDAIMAAENQRNLGTAQSQALGQAYGNAFNAAQNQYNQGQGLQLQANQAAMQGANQLAGLGAQQLQAQQGIIGLQNQMGAQQQAQQQNIMNQGIQNYATAQQYPQQQLAFMNSMLRGLPLQTQTVQGYQAAPSSISQLAGLGTAGIAGLGLYNTMNRPQ